VNYLSEVLMRMTFHSFRSVSMRTDNTPSGRAVNSWVRSFSFSRESWGLFIHNVIPLLSGPARTTATCSTVQQHTFWIAQNWEWPAEININIAYCRVSGLCILDGVWIGFIDCLYTTLRTTGNYNAISDLHTLHFTVTHTSVLSLH
jgi:hypothetical protein